jgi:hypothetical protein
MFAYSTTFAPTLPIPNCILGRFWRLLHCSNFLNFSEKIASRLPQFAILPRYNLRIRAVLHP